MPAVAAIRITAVGEVLWDLIASGPGPGGRTPKFPAEAFAELLLELWPGRWRANLLGIAGDGFGGGFGGEVEAPLELLLGQHGLDVLDAFEVADRDAGREVRTA